MVEWIERKGGGTIPSTVYLRVSSSVLPLPQHDSDCSSSTCQDIMPPRLQLMRPAHSIKRLLSRFQSPSHHKVSQSVFVHISFHIPHPTSHIPQHHPHPDSSIPASQIRLISGFGVQMISIIQTKPTPRLLELFGRQPFERSLRSHRHENRQRNGAVWEVKRSSSRAGRLYMLYKPFVSDCCAE